MVLHTLSLHDARPISVESDPRTIWRRFADHYPLFRGTPSRMWLDWVFANIFGIEEVLSAANANTYFDTINAALATDAFRPPALFERLDRKRVVEGNSGQSV